MTGPHTSLIAVLFFLAVANAPKNPSEIQVTGPDFSAHWKMTPEGWRGGQDHAKDIWSIKNNKSVEVGGGQDHDKNQLINANDLPFGNGLEDSDDEEDVDVATFVKPALNHDWSRKSKVKLSAGEYVEKTDAGFVYTNHEAKSAEKFQITYNNDGSPYTDILLEDWGDGTMKQDYQIKESHADSLPKWTPANPASIPLSVGETLKLLKEKFDKMHIHPTSIDLTLTNGHNDYSENIWFYQALYYIEEFEPQHTISGNIVLVLLDGSIVDAPRIPYNGH